ncbi:MAG TPA: carboxypeptidase-like regulatory domain-containing protein, partial [Blastocatellia bacterium]|nr:carboxypeptidase-like regulatory domain-containing protein [Blastocatellia bacterium]
MFGGNLNKQRRGTCLLLVTVFLLTCSLASPAQSTFGTITGTVTDPTGALLPGATVVVTSKTTQLPRTVTTNAEGIFLVANLDPGIYSIEVKASGFASSVNTVELLARQILRIDVRMETAATTERIDVVAQSA